MTRYFFHIHDGTAQPDLDGLEFANDRAAWHEATRACGEMLAEIDGKLNPGGSVHMEVRDQTGRICWNLDIRTSGVSV